MSLCIIPVIGKLLPRNHASSGNLKVQFSLLLNLPCFTEQCPQQTPGRCPFLFNTPTIFRDMTKWTPAYNNYLRNPYNKAYFPNKTRKMEKQTH
jgi:hypothetical protein